VGAQNSEADVASICNFDLTDCNEKPPHYFLLLVPSFIGQQTFKEAISEILILYALIKFIVGFLVNSFISLLTYPSEHLAKKIY